MNWMIDGAYGDLYREAMGYPQLQPHDEWEIERRVAKRPGLLRRGLAALRKKWPALRSAMTAAAPHGAAKAMTTFNGSRR